MRDCFAGPFSPCIGDHGLLGPAISHHIMHEVACQFRQCLSPHHIMHEVACQFRQCLSDNVSPRLVWWDVHCFAFPKCQKTTWMFEAQKGVFFVAVGAIFFHRPLGTGVMSLFKQSSCPQLDLLLCYHKTLSISAPPKYLPVHFLSEIHCGLQYLDSTCPIPSTYMYPVPGIIWNVCAAACSPW